MTRPLLQAWDGHRGVHGDATEVIHAGIVGVAGAGLLGAISRKEPVAYTGPRPLYTHKAALVTACGSKAVLFLTPHVRRTVTASKGLARQQPFPPEVLSFQKQIHLNFVFLKNHLPSKISWPRAPG